MTGLASHLPRGRAKHASPTMIEDHMRTSSHTTKARAKNGGDPAQQLRQLMAETGYTSNSQLADDMGISVNTVANWLAGRTEPAKSVMMYLDLKRRIGAELAKK